MIISDLTYLEPASEVTGIVGGCRWHKMYSSGGGGYRTSINRSALANQEANVNQTNLALGGDTVIGDGGPAIVALNFATSQPDQVVINQ